ncbi:MAG: hypothetical protein D6732_16260 [Methanobacteriota archaeon]|nr:MAG: hypothetical protein D6732_16260 [Euryarchaeota archaeon]
MVFYAVGTAVFLFGLHLENLVLQVTGPIIVTLSKIFATVALFLPTLRRFFQRIIERMATSS